MTRSLNIGPAKLLPGRASVYLDETCAAYVGEAVDVLRDLPDVVVDAVVTDPPAGIGFRGLQWDTFPRARGRARASQKCPARQAFVEFLSPVMNECLRVLKPGAHALVWALPRTSHWTAVAIEDAGFEIRDVVTHHFGTGFPKAGYLKGRWRGWSTALKPASEHWILARKPLDKGGVNANLRSHGTGAINIAACRVDSERWPANLVLSHHGFCRDGRCAAGCPIAQLDRQTIRGSASRFFYVAKPTTAEKSLGLPRASAVDSPRRDDEFRFRFFSTAGGNSHPTVKSVALMSHLCRLITPPGGLIVDPFMGSGSTGVAALREGFTFLGVEKNPEYALEIAVHRLRHTAAESAGRAKAA